MIKVSAIKTLIDLVIESRKLFGKDPSTRNMRRQWIAQTQELLERGIHLKQTGKFPGSRGGKKI